MVQFHPWFKFYLFQPRIKLNHIRYTGSALSLRTLFSFYKRLFLFSSDFSGCFLLIVSDDGRGLFSSSLRVLLCLCRRVFSCMYVCMYSYFLTNINKLNKTKLIIRVSNFLLVSKAQKRPCNMHVDSCKVMYIILV